MLDIKYFETECTEKQVSKGLKYMFFFCKVSATL